MIILVDVTAPDIFRGAAYARCSIGDAIFLALRRATTPYSIDVLGVWDATASFIRLPDGENCELPLPNKVKKFLRKLEHGHTVAPFVFELDIPLDDALAA